VKFVLSGDGLRPIPISVLGLLIAATTAVAEDCSPILARAQKAFAARQLDAAVAELESAAARCPREARVWLALGQAQYLAGKEIEAEKSLLAALEIEPAHEEALYALGRVYAMQNRYPDSVEKLQAVLRINPKNHKAWDNLGVAYDALNQEPEALRSFFRALDLVMKDHPDYDWAHANLADFFLRRNEFEKAFQLANEAARRNPASARNCFLTAKALVRLEKHELSLRWLEQAVKLDANYPEALYVLAQTYRKLGRAEDAGRTLARFQEASKNRPRR
jgi:tetratricopeptide (TPR) repeat protein